MGPPSFLVPFPLLLFPFAVYLSTLGPCFLDGDSPETVTAGATLGIPHPPGYALSILSTRLFTLLPLGNPAFASALGSALWASLALLLLVALVQRVSRSPSRVLPLCAGALLALSPHFWQEALSPKGAVYTLQGVLLLAFLWTFLRADRPGAATAGAFLFGLGLSNHWPTQIWFLPLLLGSLLGLSRTHRIRALLFLGLGLSPLLVLPLLSHLGPALDLGAPDSLGRFLDHLSRKVYRASREAREWTAAWSFLGERTGHLAGHLLAFPGWLALPLAAFGIRRSPPRLKALAVPGALLLGALWLYPSVPETFWTLDRFLLPVDALVLLFAGIGMVELSVLFPERRGNLIAAVLALSMVAVGLTRPPQSPWGPTFRYDHGANLLKSAPKGSLFFAEAEDDVFPLHYLQEVLGKRKDVRVVPSFLLFEGWGVEGVGRRFKELGLEGPSAYPNDPIGRLSAATADLWVKNRAKAPIVFTRFEGALHRYVLPAYPNLAYRRIGLLEALDSPALGHLPSPSQGDLRLRTPAGSSSPRDPALKGILEVYRGSGFPVEEVGSTRP